MISGFGIRQLSEKKEETLSRFAIKSRDSRGRLIPEDPDPVRTAFQRDRDRILHTKSFRRLMHKTQVFIAPKGDHFVTRLTHTLEVSQIARTIARALNLNEDLTEAISLGHDLGHTAFGHVGEQVLNEVYIKGFKHNEQSLRTIDVLENDGRGLNLTWEVRDGILNHSKPRANVLKGEEAGTLEGEICKIADAVAYINHDIGDAIRADIITERSLPLESISVLGNTNRDRINTMVCDIIENSWAATGKVSGEDHPTIIMGEKVLNATNVLREFLFDKVYNVNADLEEATRAKETVKDLYFYFRDHREKLPPEYLQHADEVERGVVDYIAGMTDQYATRTAEKIASGGV